MSLFKDPCLKDNIIRSQFTIALSWGVLWGLSEATLGHSLHLLRIPGLAGFVMFPAGIFFMMKAYLDSKSLSIIFSTAVVAAAIKLLDLWLPGISALDVLKPAIAIVCESLAIIALLSIIENRAFQRHLIRQ